MQPTSPPGYGSQIAVLRTESFVHSADFSPDGNSVVVALNNDTAWIWDVAAATMSADDLVVEVCTRRLRGMTRLSPVPSPATWRHGRTTMAQRRLSRERMMALWGSRLSQGTVQGRI